MATTIKLKNGSGAPTTGDLVQGEPAFDLTNKRLYTEDSGGSVIEVGTNPTSLTTGTFTSTGIDDNATSTAITIDSDGDVGIGLASPLFQAADRTAVTINGTTSSNLVFGVGGSANTYFLADSSGFTIGNTSATLPTMFYTNGAERMRIDSSGNVGIGTTSPNTYANYTTLTLNGAASSALDFEGGGTLMAEVLATANDLILQTTNSDGQLIFKSAAGSEAMRIDSSGNLLVGKTSSVSANTRLDVAATETSTATSAGGGAAISIQNLSTTNNTYSTIYFTNGGAGVDSAIYGVHEVGNGTGTGRTGSIVFATAALGSGVLEKMRIDGSGNVGIGTTSPSFNSGSGLEISRADTCTLRVENTGTGASSAEFFAGNDKTVIGSTSNTHLQFRTNATERMRIDYLGKVGIGTNAPISDLTVSNASGGEITLRYTGNSGYTSIQTDAANDLIFGTGVGASERMRLDSSGNLQLGVTTGTNRRFYLRASGSTSTQYACQMENSGGQNLFFVRADGAINTGEDGKSPYNDTTASAANLVVNSSGFLLRSTSSARYKENIRDYDQTASIDALRPVFFNSKKEDDDKTYAGLIAEEVHEAGFTEFVEYNKDGEPDAVFYANMVALCIKEIQDLKAEVAALKGE